MTNPALDIIDNYMRNMCPPDDVSEAYETIRTALANAPQVVTVEEFCSRMNAISELGRSAWRGIYPDLMQAFPNGLIITAAPNGGAE